MMNTTAVIDKSPTNLIYDIVSIIKSMMHWRKNISLIPLAGLKVGYPFGCQQVAILSSMKIGCKQIFRILTQFF